MVNGKDFQCFCFDQRGLSVMSLLTSHVALGDSLSFLCLGSLLFSCEILKRDDMEVCKECIIVTE